MVQGLICFLQIFNPTIFNSIWSAAETRGLLQSQISENLFIRITGTLVNPIIFASIITFLTFFIVSYERAKIAKYWIILGFVLVVFSGSRTVYLLYPLIATIWLSLNSLYSFKGKILYFIFSLFLLYILLDFVLSFFSRELAMGYQATTFDILRYCYKFITNLLYGSESDVINVMQNEQVVKTLAIRTYWMYITVEEFVKKDLFGTLIGSNTYNFKAHSDYLHMITRYGVLGLATYICLIANLIFAPKRFNSKNENVSYYLIIIFFLIIGSVNIILVEMKMGIYLAIFCGMVFGKEFHYTSGFSKVYLRK